MAEREEIFRNYGFFLELQGERAAYFMKVSGLGLSIETVEYRAGGMPTTVHKLPGRTRVNDVWLSHGITQSDSMWRWLDTAVQGKVERRNVSVVVLGTDGQSEVTRWNLGNAWLRECDIEDFDALGNNVLIARMSLVAETLERAPVTTGT